MGIFAEAVALSGHVTEEMALKGRPVDDIEDKLSDVLSDLTSQVVGIAVKEMSAKAQRGIALDVDFENIGVVSEGSVEDEYQSDPRRWDPAITTEVTIDYEVSAPRDWSATAVISGEVEPRKHLRLVEDLLRKEGLPMSPEGKRYLAQEIVDLIKEAVTDDPAYVQEIVEEELTGRVTVSNEDEIADTFYDMTEVDLYSEDHDYDPSMADLDIPRPSAPSFETIDDVHDVEIAWPEIIATVAVV